MAWRYIPIPPIRSGGPTMVSDLALLCSPSGATLRRSISFSRFSSISSKSCSIPSSLTVRNKYPNSLEMQLRSSSSASWCGSATNRAMVVLTYSILSSMNSRLAPTVPLIEPSTRIPPYLEEASRRLLVLHLFGFSIMPSLRRLPSAGSAKNSLIAPPKIGVAGYYLKVLVQRHDCVRWVG